MMTLHKLSAGDGYRYYTHQVATGDALREQGRELGDYYTVKGMPPGQWIGSGVTLLEGFGEVTVGGEVTEEQMHALFGAASQPMTGTEIAVAFSDAHHAGKTAHAEVFQRHQDQAAQLAWVYYQLGQEGASQAEIAQAFTATGTRMTQRSVSRHLQAYAEAGNTMFGVKNQQAEPLTRSEFLATYTMTAPEAEAAQKAAGEAKRTAEKAHLEQLNLGQHYRTYRGRTGFQQRFHEEVARHNRTEKTAPTAQDFAAIRNRVGAQLFREAHGREAADGEELRRWIDTQDKNIQQNVAGFDLVFTPTKSVSAAWGLGDERLRKGIEAAHEGAIRDALDYLENNAVYTRRGYNGVRQTNVVGGLIATKFRHHDSRTGDPNLHDHVVVANKVKGEDGSWLSLDGRMLFKHNVAASEVYNSRIIERIRETLGLEFVAHQQRGGKVFEIAGIDPKLISGFSSRRAEINQTLSELEEKFVAEHGHAPTAKQRNALAQQATLATRPAKEDVTSLQELNVQWRERAQQILPGVPVGEELAEHLKQASAQQAAVTVEAAAEVAATPVVEHAQKILTRLENQRSTWTRSNITAEAQRYFREAGAGVGIDPEQLAAAIDQVQDLSVGLTPQMDVPVPAGLRRADGTSQYVVAGSERFTSTGIIHAEDALIRAATVSPVIPVATQAKFEKTLKKFTKNQGWTPAAAQVAMARAFATSEQLLAVGIGPAGAGKTTSTSLFVRTAEAAGSQVIGLAPTAAAASVMGQEMDIQADTVDSFLMAYAKGEKKISAGSVLLVDEMGMLTTPKLARLVQIAQDQGAVIRGIGDHRQLAAIGSGGALRLLEREAGAVHLEDVHRFRHADGTVNEAEAAASLALREPPPSGIEDAPFDWYLSEGRVQAGSEEKMLGEIFARWAADTDAGRSALMAAPSNAQVQKLNELAQAKCMRDGLLDPSKVFTTNTGASIHPGDVILTRDNNRRLRLNQGKDFVKNGDAWTVQEILDDGRLKVKHQTHGGVTTLPAAYASENVELGYASTVNRAQGVTVDRAYTLLDASITRENAYVGTSRGRCTNELFVATTPEAGRDEVLATIAGAYEQNLSIHETVAREREAHRAITPRAEIYQDLSLLAQEQIVAQAAQNALGVENAAALINSDGYGAFAYEVGQLMRDHQVDPEALIRRAWDLRGVGDAEDIGAVMHWRVGVVMDNDHTQNTRTPEQARPFSAVSDEHLDALITKAKQRAEAQDAAVEHAAGNLEDPGWFKREFGLVPDKLLTARRKGLAERMRDNDDPEWRWLLAEMDAEVSRRRWSSPEQRMVEQVARGERPRAGTDLALARALKQEQKIRTRLIPRASMPEARPEQVTHGVSGWLVDPTWAEHHLVPKNTADVLKTHHERIGQLAELRGRQLAVQKPAWTEALGEVPINPTNARRWYRVAAEVEAYRVKYRVPEHEAQPIPKDHYKQTSGLSPKGQHAAYLAEQVVDVHKRGALSNRPARSTPENQLTAQTTEQKVKAAETATEAERIIDPAAEARRQRLREMSQRLEAPDSSRKKADSSKVSELLGKLKSTKSREQAQREEAPKTRRPATPDRPQSTQDQQRRGPRI